MFCHFYFVLKLTIVLSLCTLLQSDPCGLVAWSVVVSASAPTAQPTAVGGEGGGGLNKEDEEE